MNDPFDGFESGALKQGNIKDMWPSRTGGEEHWPKVFASQQEPGVIVKEWTPGLECGTYLAVKMCWFALRWLKVRQDSNQRDALVFDSAWT